MAKKKPYRFLLYLLGRMGAGLFSLLPRSLALRFARFVGAIGYYVVTRYSGQTREHLQLAFGREKSEAEINRLARGVFEHLAMTGAEILQFPKLTREKVAKIVNAEEATRVYDSILKEGKGLISITAHIGNWELLAGTFGIRDYRGAVLARRIYYEPFNQWIVGLRQAIGVPTLYRDQSSREILERLADNQIIGLLPDQDLPGLKGIFVPFFGRLAYTPVAPVRLSLSSGAPIVTNFLVWEKGDDYRLIVGEVIRPRITTTRDEAIRVCTEMWMRSFEQVIRRYPDQWAWMHDRWKTQPETSCRLQATGHKLQKA